MQPIQCNRPKECFSYSPKLIQVLIMHLNKLSYQI